MCPNVLVTSHQAFLTREALAKISNITLGSVRSVEAQWRGDAPKVAADQRTVLVGVR
jgi:phosphoglycerate dehydrogenase-like enzyme